MSKENGGTLGWVSIGQMKDSIRKKIEAAKPQSILPPFEDNKNIVLLKVGNKRDLSNGKGATQKEPKITKEQASNIVFSRKLEEEGQRFTNKIYKEAYI
ncbi:MAG: peptidylprolyl isomerase, partial [Pirellulaceae bacterium]